MQGGRSLALLAVAVALVAAALAPTVAAQVPGTSPPTADFSFSPESPIAGQDVRFHDMSINGTKNIYLYIWSTSDGQRYRHAAIINASHYQQNPPDKTFRFPEAGTYDVTLAITDRAGHQDEKTRSVTVRPGLSAVISLVQDGANVTVDASGSTSPYGNVVSYKWIWGDGTPNATGARATHRYATPGNHTLKLEIADDQGLPGRAQQVVSVAEVPPTADFTVDPLPGHVGRPVLFTDASVAGPFAPLASRTWKVDGQDAGAEPTLTRVFPEPGTYTVSLTVTDGRGLNATATRAVRVLSAPTAIFSVDAEGRGVTVDASLSKDDGRIVSYEWDWGDGARSTGVQATHDYPAIGEYVLTLTLTDDEGARTTANRTLTLEGRPVVVAFSMTSTTAQVGQTVHLLDGSRDPEGPIQAWRWEFGDGSTGEGAETSHAYAAPGRYVVNLTVTDSQGGLARASQTLTIEPRPAPTVPSTPRTSTPVTPGLTPQTPTAGDPVTPAATTVTPATTSAGETPAGTVDETPRSEAPGASALLVAALAALAGLLLPRRRR